MKKDGNTFHSGERSFVVHLNENLYNVCGNFSWSFDRENLCRSCYEGLFRTHADSFYVLNLKIFQVFEYNICGIVEQMLVEVRLSLLGRKVRFSVTFLWLKFLVLILFPCYAGFFDHPKLDTEERDHLKARD